MEGHGVVGQLDARRPGSRRPWRRRRPSPGSSTWWNVRKRSVPSDVFSVPPWLRAGGLAAEPESSTRRAAAVRRMEPTLAGVATESSSSATRPGAWRRHSRWRRLRSVLPRLRLTAVPSGSRRRLDLQDPVAGPRGRAARWASPASASQRASESAPRCFWTTSARRAGAGAQAAEPAWRAARGGRACRRGSAGWTRAGRTRRSAGTSSGASDRAPGRRRRWPRRWPGRGPGPARSRRRPTPSRSGPPRRARVTAIGPVAAADVDQRAGRPASRPGPRPAGPGCRRRPARARTTPRSVRRAGSGGPRGGSARSVRGADGADGSEREVVVSRRRAGGGHRRRR